MMNPCFFFNCATIQTCFLQLKTFLRFFPDRIMGRFFFSNRQFYLSMLLMFRQVALNSCGEDKNDLLIGKNNKVRI